MPSRRKHCLRVALAEAQQIVGGHFQFGYIPGQLQGFRFIEYRILRTKLALVADVSIVIHIRAGNQIILILIDIQKRYRYRPSDAVSISCRVSGRGSSRVEARINKT